ncbi:MAG: hypothetical protein CHACPFDD_00412 [Phycisphaerae bacterium]|nr:hypothetical protein [Phycisphaerae bacterium]
MRSQWTIVVCAAAFALAPAAWSEIVYTDISDVTLAHGEEVDLDVDQDGAADVVLWVQWSDAIFATALRSQVDILAWLDEYGRVFAPRLQLGELVGVTAQSWRPEVVISTVGADEGCNDCGFWGCYALDTQCDIGVPVFLGVRLSSVDGSRYCWIRVQQDFDRCFGWEYLTVFDFAFQTTPNLPIAAGNHCLAGADCNGNGTDDCADVAADPSLDCNQNSVLDQCELAADPTLDCDGDGALDSCQIAADPSLDCNANGRLDACDIAVGVSRDCDGDGTPDECQPDTAPFGGAAAHLSFHGEYDAVRVPGLGAAMPTTEITIEFWQWIPSIGERTTFNVVPHDPYNRVLVHTPWVDGNVYWDFGSAAGPGRLNYLPPVSLVGTWQHFAFVASQSGNFMKIYRNGVLEASRSGFDGYDGTLADFEIGNDGDPGPYGFVGQIDEFRIWSVARSSAEIAANYRRRVSPLSPGLVACYRFDERDGSTVTNLVGGYDGTLEAGVTRAAGICTAQSTFVP